MLTLHLRWGQDEIQKGHAVYCFEGVTDIKQGGQTQKFQKDIQGQLW